jgi:uncharacterized protein (DUF2147 family)
MNFSDFSARRVGRSLAAMVVCVFGLPALAFDPAPITPTGLWRTHDDKTGKPRGFVRVYEENGEIFGKIESSLDPADAKERCEKCSGARKNQPVIGLVILRGMKKTSQEYSGGDILDPDTGVVYRCRFRMLEEGKKLELRGYLGVSVFGRSQVWIRQD